MSNSYSLPDDTTRSEFFGRMPESPRRLSTVARLSLLFSGGIPLYVGFILVLIGSVFVSFIYFGGEYILTESSTAAVITKTVWFLACIMSLLVFPGLGLVFVGYGIQRGRKHLALIENGRTGQAKYDCESKTQVMVNCRVLIKLIYRFQTPDGLSHKAIAYTNKPEKFKSGDHEKLVFYDPDKPSCNILWDKLTHMKPRAASFDPERQVFRGSIFRLTYGVFIVSLLFVELLFGILNIATAIRILAGS